MKLDEYQPIERKAVFLILDGLLGFAVSRKMIHEKWTYFIFTNAGIDHDAWFIATENEVMFLE